MLYSFSGEGSVIIIYCNGRKKKKKKEKESHLSKSFADIDHIPRFNIAYSHNHLIVEIDNSSRFLFESFQDAIDFNYPTSLKANQIIKAKIKQKKESWIIINKKKILEITRKRFNEGYSSREIYLNYSHFYKDLGIKYSDLLDLRPTEEEPEKKEVKQNTTNPHTISKIQDLSKDFDTEYHALSNIKYPDNKKFINAFLGIDFGTSFTKVAWFHSMQDNGIITFGNNSDCFKPSVVYLSKDKKSLSFFEKKDFTQIRFFKATMDVHHKKDYESLYYKNLFISNNDTQTSLIKNNFELICSAFFLANIIFFSKYKISSKLNKKIDYLSVTMGAPVLSDSDNSNTIYNIALKVGFEIAESSKDPSLLEIDSLLNLVLKAKQEYDPFEFDLKENDPQVVTIPELFTESLYLLNQRSFDIGNYLIVDIGGGTADCCVFIKQYPIGQTGENKTPIFNCPYAKVAPLGNEIRLTQNSLEEKKAYENRFKGLIQEIVFKTKQRLEKAGQIVDFNILLFGGGAIEDGDYYKRIVDDLKNSNHMKGLNIKLMNIDPFKYPLPTSLKNLFILPKNKQRLLIAIQLANPQTRDAFLSDSPMDYANRYKAPSQNDFYHQDRRREIGYEDIN